MAPSAEATARAARAAAAGTTPTNQAEIDLSSPLFNAARYLAVTHAHTSFPELQTALTELRKTTSDKTAQLKALVSAHFDQYLSCHEAVRALAADVSAHQQETEALVGDMQNLSLVADASLAVMLQRAREQRRIRHTLVVLARLRPILELTSKMKTSLRIQDYDTLAVDYARLKHQSGKIANLAAPLKRVVTAGHEIAATANAELLKRLEDMSASAADQKRAIDVLTALGLVEKPILTCLTKQFEYLERKLDEINIQETVHITSEDIMKECVAIAARFRNGLWGFICELFKTPAGSAAATSNAITSVEAERVQQQAWSILSKCAGLLEQHASPPSALRLKLLTEAFRQFRCLQKCPNAATLNTNIEQLNESFCDKFRAAITLGYLDKVCQSAQSDLLAEYFEPVVTVLPSLPSEIALGTPSTSALTPVVMSTAPRTKVQRMIMEARQAFDVIRNASTISSESKILLHRPLVFTTCATDVLQRWKGIWKDVGQVLLDVLDIADHGNNKSWGKSVPSSPEGDVDFHFRTQLVQALEKHLRDMLSEFLDKVVAAFVAEINPPVPVEASTPTVVRANQGGARVCILLAIVANCVELREKCLRIVDGWVAQLKYGDIDEDFYKSMLEHGRAATSGTRALANLVQNVETKCMDIYSSTHAEPLQRILRAGAAEEPFQTHSTSSTGGGGSRHSSRTNRSGSVGLLTPAALQAAAASPASSVSMPSDPRQYVFNVLLQLITLRSEVEMSVGEYPQCWDYIRSVTDPLTAALAEFLQNSVRGLDSAAGASSLSTSTIDEWKRNHLLVEARFFQLALGDLMAESTKSQIEAVEKQLAQAKSAEQATSAGHVTLLNQMKHQTKLYLLALQQ
ncbi:Vacuolar-sorting receptor 1 [Phytophthora cinnamomi]|uniref:Vacuolar-sorting receptor 1 n=1 Tax=Phytophthora cinnamomi TaxID=4785 RepID=UPI003559DEAE|nr:Vacuolar-sorting receptor 1 [Phytophthora cinnamomi]